MRSTCKIHAGSRYIINGHGWLITPTHNDGTVYPKKYAHGFVVLCFVVVMQSFIMNSHEVFIHIHQGCFAGTGAIVRLPQCQWSKPDGYGKISQCITTTKHSKAKTVCIFLGIYCMCFLIHSLTRTCFTFKLILMLRQISTQAISVRCMVLYIHVPISFHHWRWIFQLRPGPCQHLAWLRHHMESFSALLALCAGNWPVTGEFPSQRPVTWSSDVFFDLCLNKRLSKQSWGWWFETPSRPLRRHSIGCLLQNRSHFPSFVK